MIHETEKKFLEKLNECKTATLWKIEEAEELLQKRVSKQEVSSMFKQLDDKFTQHYENLEHKIIDRIFKSYREQDQKIETLRQYHEDKIKDL